MNLAIFLEYDKELNVRGKNKKEKLLEVLTSVQKSGDELLLSNTLKDVDEFFDNVMVNADDEALRKNRLALLSRLRALFLGVADISILAPTKK